MARRGRRDPATIAASIALVILLLTPTHLWPIILAASSAIFATLLILGLRPGKRRAKPRASTGCVEATYLPGPAYLGFVRDLILRAERRVAVAMYVVKRGRLVDELLAALTRSRAREKLVVLESRDVGGPMRSNAEVVEWLRRRGVNAVLARGSNVQHLKLVVVDDWVVVGSHNWTDRALSRNDEVSIAIRDPAIADAAYRDVTNVARGIRVGT